MITLIYEVNIMSKDWSLGILSFVIKMLPRYNHTYVSTARALGSQNICGLKLPQSWLHKRKSAGHQVLRCGIEKPQPIQNYDATSPLALKLLVGTKWLYAVIMLEASAGTVHVSRSRSKKQCVNYLTLHKGCCWNMNLLSASQMPDTAHVVPVPCTKQPSQAKLRWPTMPTMVLPLPTLSSTEAHPMSISPQLQLTSPNHLIYSPLPPRQKLSVSKDKVLSSPN